MYDAIVLAGGRARRLGGAPKPQLPVGGRSLLDSVLAAVSAATRVVVVGPEQPAARPVLWRREEPAGAGPVAALAAGLPATTADVVVVLAADLPAVAPAVPRLVAAVPLSGASVLVDPGGRLNYLAAAWRRPSLVAALSALPELVGASMRSLTASAPLVEVADEGDWGRDCDTWDDLARARAFAEGGDAGA